MKKVLALLLVLVLALGMSTMAFAAGKVKKAIGDGLKGAEWFSTATYKTNTSAAVSISGTEIALGEIGPNQDAKADQVTEIKVPLLIANFNADGAWASPASTKLTKDDVKASRMSAKFKASKGSNVIDDVSIDGGDVLVEFVNPFQSNNPDGQDFDVKVYLVVDGKTWSASALSITGTYANECDDTEDADTDWYDFSDGRILKPAEFIRTLEGDLGEGVVVNMRALKNAKYWGIANTDMNDADQELLVKYSAIDQVFHIKQIGIANVANFVTLGDADPTAYVYDKDLNYIGRGNAKLPMLETYYLSANELTVDTDDEPIDGEDEEPGYDPDDIGGVEDLGGDDLYPENPHDNPGTGK